MLNAVPTHLDPNPNYVFVLQLNINVTSYRFKNIHVLAQP